MKVLYRLEDFQLYVSRFLLVRSVDLQLILCVIICDCLKCRPRLVHMYSAARENDKYYIVSVDCQLQLPMDKDEESLLSTYDVLKGIWSGCTLAGPSGCSSDSEHQEETSGDV